MAKEKPQLDLAQAIRLADELEKMEAISHETRNRAIALLGRAWKTPDKLTEAEKIIASSLAKIVTLDFMLRKELNRREKEFDTLLAECEKERLANQQPQDPQPDPPLTDKTT